MLKVLLDGLKTVGKTLGKIQTTILLILMYYLLVFPIGVLMQVISWFGDDGNRKSYWEKRDWEEDFKNVYRQY